MAEALDTPTTKNTRQADPSLPAVLKPAAQSYEKRMALVQQAIDQDAKRAALVVKNWLGSNPKP
ncbi:hypothetical protein [Methylomagnum ishizawai]|uniref:hypothetical protein n=1 Tax=Methylomagnum ishizawai TaxID=1760988 RepID=UPI000A159BFC|nr:hypothetical protein [Methylomagnum ishizawai]BBL75197.1 hypothetical protein MishRS11D_22950 [Methylomagnum ishizawai]